MKKLVALSSTLLAFAAACGDNDEPNNPDAGPGIDAPEGIDAPVDAAPFVAPQAHSFQLSAAGHDRVMAATAGPNGSFYVVGWRQADTQAATPKHIIVGKLLATGMPDTTFGTGGFLNTMIAFTGGDDELDIATNMDGTIIVSATVAAATTNALDANDNDIALIKVTAAGALDTTWGGGDGYVVHSFNTSIAVTTTTGNPPVTTTTYPGRDGVRGLDIRQNSDGHIFIHGYTRAEGTFGTIPQPRTDTDFLVARFTNAGALDTTWANNTGKYTLNIPTVNPPANTNPNSNATARGLIVLDGGAVLAGGYANAGLSTGPQAVLYRLTPAGALDTSFNANGDIPGLWHDVVLDVQTEVYNFARQAGTDNVVTAGYGRNTGTINDWVSLRFNATTGVRDTAWGAAAEGAVFFDPTPANNEGGSNSHNAIALPGGKTLMLGSSLKVATTGNPATNPEVRDAVFAVLDNTGKLDTKYGTGINVYALGDDGVDAFWGGAVSGNNVLIVGWRGTKGTASATNNDDAYAVLLPLQ